MKVVVCIKILLFIFQIVGAQPLIEFELDSNVVREYHLLAQKVNYLFGRGIVVDEGVGAFIQPIKNDIAISDAWLSVQAPESLLFPEVFVKSRDIMGKRDFLRNSIPNLLPAHFLLSSVANPTPPKDRPARFYFEISPIFQNAEYHWTYFYITDHWKFVTFVQVVYFIDGVPILGECRTFFDVQGNAKHRTPYKRVSTK